MDPRIPHPGDPRGAAEVREHGQRRWVRERAHRVRFTWSRLHADRDPSQQRRPLQHAAVLGRRVPHVEGGHAAVRRQAPPLRRSRQRYRRARAVRRLERRLETAAGGCVAPDGRAYRELGIAQRVVRAQAVLPRWKPHPAQADAHQHPLHRPVLCGRWRFVRGFDRLDLVHRVAGTELGGRSGDADVCGELRSPHRPDHRGASWSPTRARVGTRTMRLASCATARATCTCSPAPTTRRFSTRAASIR